MNWYRKYQARQDDKGPVNTPQKIRTIRLLLGLMIPLIVAASVRIWFEDQAYLAEKIGFSIVLPAFGVFCAYIAINARSIQDKAEQKRLERIAKRKESP